jgi:Spy/CpxP family protein refolding chaperone
MVSPRNARVMGITMLIIAFAVGALVGATTLRVAGGSAAPERSGRPERRGPDLFERLNLTPDQKTQVDAIMERRRVEMEAFWKQHGPTLRAIYDSTRVEIRAVLTPEQRELDDRFMAERRSHFNKRDGEKHNDRTGPAR